MEIALTGSSTRKVTLGKIPRHPKNEPRFPRAVHARSQNRGNLRPHSNPSKLKKAAGGFFAMQIDDAHDYKGASVDQKKSTAFAARQQKGVRFTTGYFVV